MEYVIIARLNVVDAPEVKSFLESDRFARKVESRSSKRRPVDVNNETSDVYFIRVHVTNENRAKKLFNQVKTYMDKHNIYGIVNWHICRHEESEPLCVFEEVYVRKPEGVDR